MSSDKQPLGAPYPSYDQPPAYSPPGGYSSTAYPPMNQAYPPPGQAYPPPGQGYPPPGQTYPPPSESYPPPGGSPPSYGMQPTSDPEIGYIPKDTAGILSFDEKTVRLVYGILGLQMLVTVIITCVFVLHEPTKLFVQRHLGAYIAAYCVFFVLYFVLVCCTKVSRNYPCNLIMLALFTLSLSYMVGAISSFHNTKIVLMAFGLTTVISVSIMLFACQTKYDFTTCGGVLLVCCLCLFFFGIFAGIFVSLKYIGILHMVYSALGALLFMAFLAFDTQLIMGGRKYEISPEDYVFASMMLYVDIIYIFLFILSLFGGSNN